MEYVLLFLEGLITFISPCLLPMLPVYMSYFAGKDGRPLANSIGFVAGFTTVFVMLGALSGTVGGFLLDHAAIVNIVTGAFVVILGLGYLGLFRVPAINLSGRFKMVRNKPLTFATSILFGMVFSIAWTPCISVYLGSALLLASLPGSAATGMLMLFVFSMGLGLPFIISAVMIDRLKVAFDFIKKHYRVVNAISGGILVVIGILMMLGLFGRYMEVFR